MSISELNCHVKQAANQEILTDVSKMSGYQIFHEEGCSVCCRPTTCNLFHCFILKQLKTQKIGYGNTFRFRECPLMRRIKKDAQRLKKSLRFLKSPLLKDQQNVLRGACFYAHLYLCRIKHFVRKRGYLNTELGLELGFELGLEPGLEPGFEPGLESGFPPFQPSGGHMTRDSKPFFKPWPRASFIFFFFFMNTIMGRRTGHPKENLH